MSVMQRGAVHTQQVQRSTAHGFHSHQRSNIHTGHLVSGPAASLTRSATSCSHRPPATACQAGLNRQDASLTASTSYVDRDARTTGLGAARRPAGPLHQGASYQRQPASHAAAQQQQQSQQQHPQQQYQQQHPQERRKQSGTTLNQRRQRALAALREQLPSPQEANAQLQHGQTLTTDAAARAEQLQEEYELPTGLSVTWLGTSSGNPTPARNVSCTVVRLPGCLHLVDAGEGSVRQMVEAGLKFKDVDRICLTHLHGDHCFGIGGMIRRVAHARAEALGPDCPPIHVYGPPALAALVLASLFPAGATEALPVKVIVTEFVRNPEEARAPEPMEPSQTLFYAAMAPSAAPHVPALQDTSHLTPTAQRLQGRLPRWPRDPATNATPGQAWFIRCDNGTTIAAAQLQHRVPCWGYAFQEPPSKALPRQRKVVILGDTMDSTAMAPLAYGADVIAHEATFSEGMEDKARIAQHSTGWMAGLFAARVKARHLVLTHFSARYDKGRQVPMKAKGGKGGEAPEMSAEEEMAAQNWAVGQLVAEARSTYGSGSISAAQDFFTIHIPKPQRPSFTNMQGVLQWIATAEMARLALAHTAVAASLAASC